LSPVVKKKKEKFKLPGKYLLLIVSAACVALLALTYSVPAAEEPINGLAGYVVVPLQNGVSTVGGWLVEKSEQLAEIRDLQADNKALQAKVDELTTENASLQQEHYELTKLRELYDLSQQYSSYKMTAARIIAKDSGSWYHSFVINKGSADGIAADMNVIAGNGLVGRVTGVGLHWAKVMSIIDDNSNVSAMVLSTQDNMIITGNLTEYEDGVIDFSKLTDRADQVTLGDKVVTSNISDKYLPGILIGYISTLNQDANKLTKSGQITPVVDFEHLDTVLVILQIKQTVENSSGDASSAATTASDTSAAGASTANATTADAGSNVEGQ
jgi:rod shape-determining protein MreC